MYLERIYDEDLAQASYFIGCQATGTALVIDPRRDIQEYLDLAARKQMRITAVTETHVHADFLSGTRELAAATGAHAYVSGEGGHDWQYGFEANRLYDGDEIRLGNITVGARHTPGHTPEHLSFLVTDGAFSTEPGYVFTGDFVFAGDLGRPDLLDEAAGGVDTRFEGAQQLYRSLREVFLQLPDHVQVYPGHGAGSACGRSLGALPATTVGYERLNAWWGRPLAQQDEDAFVAELLRGQPDAPTYFGRMKRQNLHGPQILGPLPPLPEISVQQAAQDIDAGAVIPLDLRGPEEVRRGAARGALTLPGVDKAATYGAWALDPESDTEPLLILAASPAQAHQVRNHLLRVGIDRIAGYTTSLAGIATFVPEVVAPEDLDEFDAAALVDVRNRSEHEAGHVPGSQHLSGGRIVAERAHLPHQGAVVTYCQSGMRNYVVAAALRRHGIRVVELDGSYAGWLAQAEPDERSDRPAVAQTH